MTQTAETTRPTPATPAGPGAADARSPDPARRALRLAYVLRRHDVDGGTPELARLLSDYRGQEPA